MKYQHKWVGTDRGLILPLVLMAFLVLGAMSTAILAIGSSEVQIASNHLRSVQADFLAEAGLEHAYNTLRTTPTLVTNANANLQAVAYNSQFGGMGSAIGGYFALYQAAGANTVRVISTGSTTVGGFQKIRRATMSTAFVSDDAIRTNDDLSISGDVGVGDPIFQGQCGSVHANDDLDIIGSSVSISGDATASDDYDTSGNPSVGPGSGGHQPEKFVPAINPPDFLNAAQASLPADKVFQMKTNGDVRDGVGALIIHLGNGDSFHGWNYSAGSPAGSPAEWSLSSNTSNNGTYYFEGNVSLAGNHGDVSTPWVVTLIATGNLIIAGSSVTQSSLIDTLFVAGLDLKLSGNASQTQVYNGMLAAHEQFSITGTPTVNGFIIGEDGGATSSLVESNTVSGNLNLTYDCNATPPLLGPLRILSWGL